MTSSEDLSREAKLLLRQARGGDRTTRAEVSDSVERFRRINAPRVELQALRSGRPSASRATPWAVLAAILSGTLGAYATVGQSLGLPVPEWFPHVEALPLLNDATATVNPGTPPLPQRRDDRLGRSQVSNGRASDEGVTRETSAAAQELGRVAESAHADVPTVLHSAPESTPVPAPQVAVTTPARTNSRGLDTTLGHGKPSSAAAVSGDGPTHDAPEAASSAATPAGTLALEVQTITAARDALAAGNCAAAIRHLDAHRLQFPRGALSEERQALSAICECRQGRGTASAEAYVGRRSGSPLARRVATECALETR